ncbi:terminase small subunit [Marinomonas shanghaiensis]|uniref:terminase small subunit n=1 Tax=Marinomonas shanghaiensis TaxID=2202418 RepID=UPI0013007082|nr:terminase small subunit [Marinomonas shanghaiensis]
MGKKVQKKELADILGVTEKTLTTWQKNGMPIEIVGGRGQRNTYDTEDVIEWLVTQRMMKAGVGQGKEVSNAYDLEIETARLKHWQATEKEISVREEAKQLIRRPDIEFKLGQIITSAKSGLMNLAPRLSQRLGLTKEQKAIVEDEVKSALVSMGGDHVIDE